MAGRVQKVSRCVCYSAHMLIVGLTYTGEEGKPDYACAGRFHVQEDDVGRRRDIEG